MPWGSPLSSASSAAFKIAAPIVPVIRIRVPAANSISIALVPAEPTGLDGAPRSRDHHRWYEAFPSCGSLRWLGAK
jgi:hypothetical protein